MGLPSIACIALAAVSVYVGLSYLARYWLSGKRHAEDASFSLMCFFAALYNLACAGLYNAAAPAEGADWQRYQIATLTGMGLCFLWFVAQFTEQRSKRLFAAFSALLLAQVGLALWNPGGAMWTETPMVKTVEFFGRTLATYHEMRPGPLWRAQSAVIVAALFYIWFALWRSRRRPGRLDETRPLLIGFTGLALGLLNDICVGQGLYASFYLTEYSFTFLIGCMAFSMHRDQIRTEEALKESENRYRSFLSDYQGIAFQVHKDYRPVFFHGAVEEITGYSKQDFLNGTIQWPDLMLPEDRDRIAHENSDTAATNKPFRVEREYRIRKKNGEMRWLREISHGVESRVGNLDERQGALYDITERKKAEDDLKRLAAAVNAAAESIIITDAEHRVLYVNPAFESLSGYRQEEMVGKTPAVLKSGKHNASFYRDLDEALAAGKIWRGRFVNRKKDGSLYEEEAVISSVLDDAGKIVNYVAVKRDVTHESQLETELRQSQKMDAIGKLAGRVAHDFTNILVVIQGNVGLLQEKIPRDRETDESFESIVEASNRACQLTSQLLAFSHRQAIALRMLDLCKTVRGGLEEMLSRTLSENIRVRTHVCPQPCTIKGDSDHIEQIVVHLSVNACDAMPSGGLVTIETARMFLDPSEIGQVTRIGGAIREPLQSGSFAVLWISDTGCGIPADVMPHIFEPFYTTKGGGTLSSGLGLSTVYGIVEQHNGFITVHSEEGKGTVFAVYFPLVGKGRREMEEEAENSLVPHGSETIVVTGKRDRAQSVLIKILHNLGYSVMEATNMEEAAALIEPCRNPVELLITDRVLAVPAFMDKMEKIKEKHPETKTLYTFGFPTMHLVETGETTLDNPILCRPFRLRDVALSVRHALGK
jgi:two-component system, cell cycle sensor histidine kinase and response regulator CckA